MCLKNIGVGLLGQFKDAGKNLGKKGTSSDITLYNYKKGDDSIFLIEPTKYPERINPLIYTVNLMDYPVVFIDEINSELGETLLLLNMLNIKDGIFVVGDYVDIEQLKSIVGNTSMKNFKIMENDPIQIREYLINLPSEICGELDDSYTKIPIDHFFTVRSVGTVILGRVLKGNVKVHQNLRVYPTENKCMVKSIQVNDKNYDTAPQYSRVGLALKGVKSEDLERGMILSDSDSLTVCDTLKLNMDWNPYLQKKVKVGEGYQVVVGLQSVSCKVEEVDGDSITLKLIKDIVYDNDDRAILIDGSAKIRILGVSYLE